jgi:hypothetical protein
MTTASLRDKIRCGVSQPLTATQISVLNTLDAINGILSLPDYISTPEYIILKNNIGNLISDSLENTTTPTYGGGGRNRHSYRKQLGKKTRRRPAYGVGGKKRYSYRKRQGTNPKNTRRRNIKK